MPFRAQAKPSDSIALPVLVSRGGQQFRDRVRSDRRGGPRFDPGARVVGSVIWPGWPVAESAPLAQSRWERRPGPRLRRGSVRWSLQSTLVAPTLARNGGGSRRRPLRSLSSWTTTAPFSSASSSVQCRHATISQVAINARSVEAVLDVGCGTGQLLCRMVPQFPDAEFVGVDPAPGMVRRAPSGTGRW